MCSYRHTQTAPLLFLSSPLWLAEAVLPLLTELPLHIKCMIWFFALLLVLFAWHFSRFTIEDRGDYLRAWFGRVDLIGVSVPYASIAGFVPETTTWIDGWGMHYVRGGWLYNIWGYDCVRIDRHRDGVPHSPVRLGTDDPAGLMELLEAKTGSNSQTDVSAGNL